MSGFQAPDALDLDESSLTSKEKELVYYFRQLGHPALDNVALSQVRSLVKAAEDQAHTQELEEIRKDAEGRGLKMP